jgi:hypothetical protein
MSAIFIYSNRSVPCQRILQYINDNPVLRPILQFYDIDEQGIPDSVRITSIPALVTQDKQVIEGRAAVQIWLESFSIPPIQKYNPGSSLGTKSLSGNSSGKFFALEQRGRNLKPHITDALQAKINATIDDSLKARAPR